MGAGRGNAKEPYEPNNQLQSAAEQQQNQFSSEAAGCC